MKFGLQNEINVSEIMIAFLSRVESIVGKGEHAGY